MGIQSGIPKAAVISINDMLEQCGRIRAGQEVLIAANADGLYGGDNLVDQEAISWIQTAVQFHGANATVLWVYEQSKPHEWRVPPVLKSAILGCNLFINNCFNLPHEEIVELKQFLWNNKIPMVKNFATTAPLLCTAWAQTPYELVSEIRYQASHPFKEGAKWQLTDDNGTHLEGTIKPAHDPDKPWFPDYTTRRHDAGYYWPWPEWVFIPVWLSGTSGVYIFEHMLSWWSRYIGISPYFSKPVRLTAENGKIKKIEGGSEADALNRFLSAMRERVGDGVYDFNCMHFGVHPQAQVGPHQCPNPLYRRLIEHSHTSNIHFHVGAPPINKNYPYWIHCTGDIRTATFRVGDTLVHDKGYLTAQDSEGVRAVLAKYPGRPGIEPEPMSF